MPYTNFEIDKCLESMVLLVDTREQPTERLKERLEAAGLPYERAKLDVGDYSCKCTLPDGEVLDFSARAVIERKMNFVCALEGSADGLKGSLSVPEWPGPGCTCLWREITGRKPIMVSTAVSLPRRP